MTTMRYKDYEATVEYDEDAEIFHGEVGDLRDVITFQGKSVAALKKAFADLIEDYLAFCKARGREPEQVRRVCPGKKPSADGQLRVELTKRAGRVEPPGPAFGRPDDKLRDTHR